MSAEPAAVNVERALIYDVMCELATSDSFVPRHSRLQDLHRRVIAALGEDDPGEFVTSDYWPDRCPR